VALAGCQGCAKVEAPPGGPPDTAPPQILAVQPESGAVVPQIKGDMVIKFDEVIDEMAGGPGGAGGLANHVLLSPVAGDVKVKWARSEIHVRPNEGWKPGRIYRLELRPGIADLRRNVLKEGRVIVFSTGPAIPHGQLTGTVVQWVEQRPAADGLVLAAPIPDTVPYRTMADSAGHFHIDALPPGRYQIYGVIDLNKNGERERREPYDSTIVRFDSTVDAVLWTFVHDTAGPRVRTAEHVDSITLRLTFTQALNPANRVDTSQVRVLALPDSTPVAIAAVLNPVDYDSLVARERAAADSARARQDTTRRPAPAAAPGPPPAPPSQPPAARIVPGGPAPNAQGDTTAFRALLRRRPVPIDRVMIRLSKPLAPGAKYLVRARGVSNLNGATGDGQAVVAVPKPPSPPRDTTSRKP